MSKKFLVASLIISTFLANATPALAANDFGLGRLINHEARIQNQASGAGQRQENNLERLKQRADKAIDRRVNELNRLLTRIQNDSRLTADDKTSVSADIQTSISGLTQLKTKIDAETDINTARADSKSIFSFKVFAVVVPKTRLLITIDNLTALNTRLEGLTPKIQDLINNLKSQGKDVSSLQALLDDVNSQLKTVATKLAQDKTTVLGVTPSSSDPHATFVSVRQDLASVRQLFAKVRSDIGQMRQAFKGAIHNITGGPTSSPSASPSASSI